MLNRSGPGGTGSGSCGFAFADVNGSAAADENDRSSANLAGSQLQTTTSSSSTPSPLCPAHHHHLHQQNHHNHRRRSSISSHDDSEITSNSSLISKAVTDRLKCKSSSALGTLLGRWSRSRPDVTYGPARSVIRKCQTVVSLTIPGDHQDGGASACGRYSGGGLRMAGGGGRLSGSPSSTDILVQPIHPYNRLRPHNGPPSLLCSRCSSLLSMASSSKYSVNDGQYVAVCGDSAASSPLRVEEEGQPVTCKLCLSTVMPTEMYTLLKCGCSFCYECMKMYVAFEIRQGADDISCPDARCEHKGELTLQERKDLVDNETWEKHLQFRRNKEVAMDATLTFCPGVDCDTVCTVIGLTARCPTCSAHFCVRCLSEAHPPGVVCPRAIPTSQSGSASAVAHPLPFPEFDSDLIKCCPTCAVPIEKDEGCAQMMCKRCKHVFCWYCLTSLDDDFLLRHYDRGPCKNKLGHSRASVIWHRTQVIGIFAGFGILLLVASPLLLLAAPCIVCCKCRVCTGGSRMDDDLPPATARPDAGIEVAEEQQQ